MGDRAIIILKSGHKYSPVAYLHWHAPQVQNYINRLREIMAGREGDLDYSFARLSGVIHNDIDGNLSFGVSNLPTGFDESDADLADLSPGDGGVYVVDIDRDYTIKAVGGYGLSVRHSSARDGGERDRLAQKITGQV